MQLRDDAPTSGIRAIGDCSAAPSMPARMRSLPCAGSFARSSSWSWDTAKLFVRFDFDLTPLGLARYSRAYYEVPIGADVCYAVVLRGGADMRACSGGGTFSLPRLAPYDSFAL